MLYEWVRVPFGLCNAPAELQRHMENCLLDVRDKFSFPYLDDISFYSDNFKAHTNHLQRVFNILTEHGIKVNAKKCKLFQKKINYLGRTITGKGYEIHKNNTDLSQIRHRFGPYNIFKHWSTSKNPQIVRLLQTIHTRVCKENSTTFPVTEEKEYKECAKSHQIINTSSLDKSTSKCITSLVFGNHVTSAVSIF